MAQPRHKKFAVTKLRITWKRSVIGCPQDQVRTIRALGLRRLHQSVEREDTPTIRGMIHKVRHLVIAEEVAGEKTPQQSREEGARRVGT